MRYVYGEFFKDRETFADRIFVSEDTFAVADGMGTGPGGRLAAEKAISLVNRKRPFTSLDEIVGFFEEANIEIMKEIAKLGDKHAAGTTLSLLTFKEGSFFVGHIGDSRIYLFRCGRLKLLTQDQISYRGGRKYVRALGIEWNPDIYTLEDTFQKGDVFLLVSDGVVDNLSDPEIESILSSDIEQSARSILNLYRENCPEEDLSFIIVSV